MPRRLFTPVSGSVRTSVKVMRLALCWRISSWALEIWAARRSVGRRISSASRQRSFQAASCCCSFSLPTRSRNLLTLA